MADIISKTDQRIAELEQELKILREFKDRYLVVSQLLGPAATPPNVVLETATPPAPPLRERLPQHTKKRARNALGSAELIAQAVAAIRENCRPMSRRDVYDALAAKGVVIEGADPLKVLGTALWRANKDIVSLDGLGYWPKMDPYPPASYFPGSVS